MLRSPWILSVVLLGSCTQTDPAVENDAKALTEPKALVIKAGKAVRSLPGEDHLRNVRQLTFGGENAEAYWSGDGTKLILQSKRPPYECDQIFILDLRTGKTDRVSTGQGRTTCSYFLQGDQRIVYSSTHLADIKCPPTTMFARDERGRPTYVWALYKGYDIFTADLDGKNLKRITAADRYDAEPTVCPSTGRIVFTSLRDGDIDLYSMEPDGSDVKRITNRLGYDGGAFFSQDGEWLVQRSSFPRTDVEIGRYKKFLQRNLMVPGNLEITVCRKDGSDFRKVTHNGKANFAPHWHPSNEKIIFSSNQDAPKGRNFELYLIGIDGKNQKRITHNPSFDGFPMFSPDGKYLVFASNRFNPPGKERDTNIFVAEWVE